MTHEQERLFRELSRALDEYEALFGDPAVICMGRARARAKVFRLHERAKAELAKPLTFSRWTPWNQRASIIAHQPGAPA